jgi:hypothetical protein
MPRGEELEAEAGGFEESEPAPAADGTLGRRLREAGADDLARLLRDGLTTLGPDEARQAMRNPFFTAELAEDLVGERRLLHFYEVRRDLAQHLRTPEALALRLIVGLYWRDLMVIGLDARLRPTLRRSADQHLLARLSEVALGEKIALARRASAAVLLHLRHDPSPRVVAALLDNPRLTEGTLAPLAHSGSTPPAVLDVIVQDRRWGVRYGLRLAIARNPSASTETALRLLPGLRKADLRAVAADAKLGGAVRQRARLLLGEGG